MRNCLPGRTHDKGAALLTRQVEESTTRAPERSMSVLSSPIRKGSKKFPSASAWCSTPSISKKTIGEGLGEAGAQQPGCSTSRCGRAMAMQRTTRARPDAHNCWDKFGWLRGGRPLFNDTRR